MKLNQIHFFSAIMMGIFVLALPQATYGLCSFSCTCSSSCDDFCTTGPFIPDCPECNVTTCGAWGTCIGSYGCDEGGECNNNGYTTTINGTSAGETLSGTSANERINGLGGGDTIYGNAGDDTIYAGTGNDTVYGGSGDDCMYGEGNNDSLNGDTGSNDFADGGSGTDTCNAETEVNCEL